jgi:hypothetical protein
MRFFCGLFEEISNSLWKGTKWEQKSYYESAEHHALESVSNQKKVLWKSFGVAGHQCKMNKQFGSEQRSLYYEKLASA